jgi:hypothetical protein
MSINFPYLNKCTNRDIIKNQKRLIKISAWQCCQNCLFYKKETCENFNAVPPDDVKIVGCEHWEYDIPF